MILRTSGLTSSAGSFLHPSTPSCVTVSTTNSHQVVTGAHDLRSMKGAMATLGVGWDEESAECGLGECMRG
ncbi:hypothetical protein BYT27DRAFT_7195501 [Phlegmacium glaucopus]|nr:hypothetical protein BYT27DRAFT_7195501 [Phlegmacium glaucopus]